MRIILASTSPRRREILALLGLPFDVVPPNFHEQSSVTLSPEEEVLQFSLSKARSLSHEVDSIIIGSDTLIALDGEKIGKPRDYSDAARILSRLSGRCHEILTGLAIIGADGRTTFEHFERIHVAMVPFSSDEIEDYLKAGESLDKAGAYSIQGLGSRLIATIRGDYLAAVGLPLQALAHHLKELGVYLPVDVEALYRERSFYNWKDIRVL